MPRPTVNVATATIAKTGARSIRRATSAASPNGNLNQWARAAIGDREALNVPRLGRDELIELASTFEMAAIAGESL
jgi:hypothetical protein